MRQSIRGWRSLRAGRVAVPATAPAIAMPPVAHSFPTVAQEPLRIGLGLISLAFYLWLIHSYKLPAGDVAVLALGVGMLMRAKTLTIPLPLALFGCLILWSLVGLGVTLEKNTTTTLLFSMAKLWIIVFCILNLIRNAAEIRFVIITWLGVFAMYPIRGAFYNAYICHCTEGGRVAWNFVFENPNDLAALTLIPMGLAAGVAYVERAKIWKYAGLIGTAVLTLTVMLTQSRGALLSIGVGVLVLAISSRKKARDLFLLFALMGAAALMAPRAVWERLGGLTNASVSGGMRGVDPEGSADSRWLVWQIALKQFKQHPFTGVGVGMMPKAHRWEALRLGAVFTVRGERDTHSTYLRLAAETGLPGLVIYVLMWGAVIRKIRQVRAKIRHVRPREHQLLTFLEVSIISFMVASIFGTYSYLSFTYISLAVAWLTAEIMEREPWYVASGALSAAPSAPRRAAVR